MGPSTAGIPKTAASEMRNAGQHELHRNTTSLRSQYRALWEHRQRLRTRQVTAPWRLRGQNPLTQTRVLREQLFSDTSLLSRSRPGPAWQEGPLPSTKHMTYFRTCLRGKLCQISAFGECGPCKFRCSSF